jgi:transposase
VAGEGGRQRRLTRPELIRAVALDRFRVSIARRLRPAVAAAFPSRRASSVRSRHGREAIVWQGRAISQGLAQRPEAQ